MGSTPKKTSKTGQAVIQRMELEGKILRDKFRGSIQVLSEKDNEWYPLEKCDMSHKDACVTYWNGRRKQRKRRRTTEVDNAINSNLAPIFLQLPVENIVYTHQQDYYNAINKSTEEALCGSVYRVHARKNP